MSLLRDTADRAERYLAGLGERAVLPSPSDLERLEALVDAPLPEKPTPAEAVLATLDEAGSPATVATAGSRYFGLVIGGALPASLAASWLASTWDQNAGLRMASPVGADLERAALRHRGVPGHVGRREPVPAGGALRGGQHPGQDGDQQPERHQDGEHATGGGAGGTARRGHRIQANRTSRRDSQVPGARCQVPVSPASAAARPARRGNAGRGPRHGPRSRRRGRRR